MPRSFVLPVTLGSLLLLALVATLAFALLRACALQFPPLAHLSSCAGPQRLAALRSVDELAMVRSDLERRIFELERELGARQCTAILADPTAPLSEEGWNNRDLSMLYGCWSLDSTYRTRDVDSGEIRTYDQWQMCFDTKGEGTEVMRSTDGMVCEGSVKARFSGDGLGLIEPGNLACADGGYIHRRDINCVLATGGKASCATFQPETNGEATVGFERAPPP